MYPYPGELKVMTYNVEWKAVSSLKSWSYCGTECSQNIANIISTIGVRYVGGNYDFIALQEIKDLEIEKITTHMNKTFKDNYNHKESVEKDGGVITFYDINKFTVKESINGKLYTYGGRPYLILIFEQGIIHINVHMPNSDHNNALNIIKNALHNYDLSKYRIIFCGDFNHNDPESLTEFNKITTFENITELHKLNTCCSYI